MINDGPEAAAMHNELQYTVEISIKIHIFWEGHKFLWNLPPRFVLYAVMVKSTVEISQNLVAFSKYMNFIYCHSAQLMLPSFYNSALYTPLGICNKFVVWTFLGQPTVFPLRSSLNLIMHTLFLSLVKTSELVYNTIWEKWPNLVN